MSVAERRDKAAENGYATVMRGDDESLALFMRNMQKFDKQFCKSMCEGADFTLRLEVRGVGGNLVHVRVYTDEVDKIKAGRE